MNNISQRPLIKIVVKVVFTGALYGIAYGLTSRIYRKLKLDSFFLIWNFQNKRNFELMVRIIILPDKLIAINKSVNKVPNLAESNDKAFTCITKGTIDLAEAIACQDGVYAFVSGVGVAADIL